MLRPGNGMRVSARGQIQWTTRDLLVEQKRQELKALVRRKWLACSLKHQTVKSEQP